MKNSNDRENTSSSSVRSSNTFNKNINKHSITSCEMRTIIGNKLASLYNSQSKTQCAGFFTGTYKTKHNTDGSLLFRDRKIVSISILFRKVCLGWKLSPIINRRGGWNKNVLGGKKSKN